MRRNSARSGVGGSMVVVLTSSSYHRSREADQLLQGLRFCENVNTISGVRHGLNNLFGEARTLKQKAKPTRTQPLSAEPHLGSRGITRKLIRHLKRKHEAVGDGCVEDTGIPRDSTKKKKTGNTGSWRQAVLKPGVQGGRCRGMYCRGQDCLRWE